jgi:hypothetical protein
MQQRQCSVDSCDRTYYARGLCEPHYRRRQRTGITDEASPIGEPPSPAMCFARSCDRTATERGLCQTALSQPLPTPTAAWRPDGGRPHKGTCRRWLREPRVLRRAGRPGRTPPCRRRVVSARASPGHGATSGQSCPPYRIRPSRQRQPARQPHCESRAVVALAAERSARD